MAQIIELIVFVIVFPIALLVVWIVSAFKKAGEVVKKTGQSIKMPTKEKETLNVIMTGKKEEKVKFTFTIDGEEGETAPFSFSKADEFKALLVKEYGKKIKAIKLVNVE